jgi:hypothetical protein
VVIKCNFVFHTWFFISQGLPSAVVAGGIFFGPKVGSISTPLVSGIKGAKRTLDIRTGYLNMVF